jgi:hypothetical protein
MPPELGSVLPEQARELGLGSGWGWWKSLLGQPPSRLVPVNSPGTAWMLGQGSSFARPVQQPRPGSAGPDWRSLGPERYRRAVSLSVGQARGLYSGSLGWCWSGCLPVRPASRLAAVMVPVPRVTLALGSSASGWRSRVSEMPWGPDPRPPARRQGVSSRLSERRCWGHLLVGPASVLKPVKSPASGRLFDRSWGPGPLLAGRVLWS